MLTKKVDSSIYDNLVDKVEKAESLLRLAIPRAEAAAEAPAPQVAEHTKKVEKLRADVNRFKTNLDSFGNPIVTVTNAAHVFSESINTNLDNESKV